MGENNLLGLVEELLRTGSIHSLNALADVFEEAGRVDTAEALRNGRLFWRHPDEEFVPVYSLPPGAKFKWGREFCTLVKLPLLDYEGLTTRFRIYGPTREYSEQYSDCSWALPIK